MTNRLSALFAIAAGLLAAQSPAFESASLKPAVMTPANRSLVGMTGGPGTSDPTRIGYHLISLHHLLTVAYDVQDFQLLGPDWLGTELFDLDATLPPETSKEQLALMLQNLLAERFKIVLRKEEKEMTVYDLVVAKGGPKLIKSSVTAGSTLKSGNVMMVAPIGDTLHLIGRSASTATLAVYLAKLTARPVFDQTGLDDHFNIDLSFGGGDMPGGETITGAVEHQLGLKLTTRKGPVAMLVIDHADKMPTEN